MSVIDDISNAITQYEGKPGDINYRNNNPGNLRSGVGQIGTNGGFAVFPDWTTGYAALQNQVTLNVSRGLTLSEFFGGKPSVYPGYAPSADSNNPLQYAAFVSSQTGIPMDVPLSNVAGVLPIGGGNSNVGNTGGGSLNLPVSLVSGADISSSPIDGSNFADLTLFDGNGNFSPSPLVWVIGMALVGVLTIR